MSSRQRPLPYVLYHSPCMDGFSSAYAAWRKFGDHASYIGVSHSDTLPELREGADIYMVDISFKRPVMLELAKKHPDIYVIDHHVTAERELAGISEEAENIHVFFDMTHSGAYLTWYFFHPSGTIPRLLLNVEDRDLWQYLLPNTREITAVLGITEPNFANWHLICVDEREYSNLVNEGAVLLRQEAAHIKSLLNEVRSARFDLPNGQRVTVPTINAPYFLASESGHALLQKYPDAPFAAVYRDTGSGRRDWSLRSEDHRESVGDIASLGYGGGGHRNAAGFSEAYSGLKVAFFPNTYDTYATKAGR